MRTATTCALLLAAATLSPRTWAADFDAAKLEFFEKKVRPIFVEHCHGCHSADTKPAGGLRVDDRNGLLTGGNAGPSVVPGKPAEGTLLKRVSKSAQKRMPAEGDFLSEEEITTLTKWVADGAAWTPVRVPTSVSQGRPEYEKLRKEHWAFQPRTEPKSPTVKDAAWPRTDIDRFVLAKLEQKGLKPTTDADRVGLIRRLTFDLTGLPPTPVEIDAYLADASADADARLIDRLLSSPRFGEQWGRHWLDVARYGESTGPSRNIPYPHAWRYRDYVIDAFNTDVPFDRFLKEQIAGDLLPAATDDEKNRAKIATGFLALGVKDVNQRFKVRFIMDNVDEQIDALCRSTMALTVSCARCHDHKFDPIPQSDYYALAGIFTSTDNAAGVRNMMGGAGLAYYAPDQLVVLKGDLPPTPPEQVAKLKAELDEAKKAWDAIRGTPEGLKLAANGFPTQRPFRLRFEKAQADYNALTDPAQRGLAAHGVRDSAQVADTSIRVRGEAEKLGPVVPRGFLTSFTVPEAKSVNPKQSGRLELAEWVASSKNPLTARVYVNRVWSQLFGRGLVSTVDNFGVNGDSPSHPELLDYLTSRFVQEGWSTKKLIRSLLQTRTYRLSATAIDENRKIDPSNSLLWRHAPRRLTSEEIRDSLLFAAGKLDGSRPEGTAAKTLPMVEMRDNGPEARTIHEAADKSLARSVYLPLLRGVTPHSLESFDPVDQTLVSGSRDNTTVPNQALFLLNSSFVRKQSLTLAETVLKLKGSDDDRLTAAYRAALGRSPTEAEASRALNFLAEYESIARSERSPKIADDSEKPKPVAKKADAANANPDEIDQGGDFVPDEAVRAKDPRTAAWMALAQSLFGSAEFRFVK